MKTIERFAIVLAALGASSAHAITIETVPIGYPGNPPDMRYVEPFHPNGVGAVAYGFRIGKTEITNSQYVAFLNAVAKNDIRGLYSPLMSDTGGIVRGGVPGNRTYSVKPPALDGTYTYDDKPVTWVNSGDAMRFANWLHNGQPMGPQNAGTTEDGAYTLLGATTDHALAAVSRNPGARWWLPNEDEWYKAAYHKNDGVTANYWDYPTRSHDLLIPDNYPPSGDTGNSANYFTGAFTTGNADFPLTDAGAYTLSGSAYGTFDQGGNVEEWNETLFTGFFRGVRGGSANTAYPLLSASGWSYEDPARENVTYLGFRVARIPEPHTIGLGVWAVAAILWRRSDWKLTLYSFHSLPPAQHRGPRPGRFDACKGLMQELIPPL